METQVDIIRTLDLLDAAIGNANSILTKSYLSDLGSAQIVPVQRDLSEEDLSNLFNEHIRFYEIGNIVYNRHENIRDKLSSVFNAVGSTGASIVMMIQGTEDSTSIKLGMKCGSSDKTALTTNLLQYTFEGNFPGTKIKNLKRDSLKKNVIDVIRDGKSVATVTDIPGIRNEENLDNESFVQGIEKFIDTMRGKEYTTLLIADHVSQSDLNASRSALERLYTDIYPFVETEHSVSKSESVSFTHSLANGVSDTVSQSTTDSVSHTVGKSTTITNSTSKTVTKGTSSTSSKGASAHGKVFGIGVGVSRSSSTTKSSSSSTTSSHSESHTSTVSDTTSHATTQGSSHGVSRTESDATTNQSGLAQSMQVKTENHQLKKLLEHIDRTLDRYEECSDLGMWNCAVYCISQFPYVSQMAASVFQSIIRGRNSSLEEGGITLWDVDQSKEIINSLCLLEHPRIVIDSRELTSGTLISSKELAILAGFPMHSVPGIPVLECAEFGRTVSRYDAKSDAEGRDSSVSLGKIWHMNHEEKLPVCLNPDSLASHVFVTGSTGAGKSCTVYRMLSELKKCGKKFLVVEPAKGEYKHVFGGAPDVSVYGTNPNLTPLLRINPFSFPNGSEDSSKNIHILEHLDRLVEIFSVCWPMYAAMPAVLKEAVQKSYEDCGWNLAESTNEYGSGLYPDFADVARNIRAIIDSSEYDAENKGAYKGSLLTRLKSLTSGINGLIFTADEIPDSRLFDENVIVDLSRAGSSETKSLIMGLLVLKLQEYRMTGGQMNASLRHVTVLEEAHNLLKRTSTEQPQDSGNLLGKSVEMLSNSIAEMRTYGEGFIIADQAPGLLDLSVIRNTNTKIIMRLPDLNDRELVGKAANLNDEQITELAKLPCGVAAVYQNEWVQSVLCKVEPHKNAGKLYTFKKPGAPQKPDAGSGRLEIAKLLCRGIAAGPSEVRKTLDALGLRASTRVMVLKLAKEAPASPRFTKLAPVIAELFPEVRSAFVSSFARTSDTVQWTDDVDAAVRMLVQQDIDEDLLRDIRQCVISDYLYNELGKTDQLERWTNEGGRK